MLLFGSDSKLLAKQRRSERSSRCCTSTRKRRQKATREAMLRFFLSSLVFLSVEMRGSLVFLFFNPLGRSVGRGGKGGGEKKKKTPPLVKARASIGLCALFVGEPILVKRESSRLKTEDEENPVHLHPPPPERKKYIYIYTSSASVTFLVCVQVMYPTQSSSLGSILEIDVCPSTFDLHSIPQPVYCFVHFFCP